ncbi:HAD hydrolase-like protein, partial [Patescibacteria group bacterium]|nr:HAD hydrolase-like protein [Patescibacteria group bacterium]
EFFDENELSSETKELFEKLKAMRFKIVIVSNTVIPSKSKRVQAISESVGVPCICCEKGWQRKPNPWGICEARRGTSIRRRRVVVIGDQVCRDIKAAFNAKVGWSILVDPISWHPFWQYLLFPRHRICDLLVRRSVRQI